MPSWVPSVIKLRVKNTFDKDVQLMSSDDKPASGMQVKIVFHMNAKIAEKGSAIRTIQYNTIQYNNFCFHKMVIKALPLIGSCI